MQISTSSTARKLVALFLIKISLTYMDIKRIYEVRTSGLSIFIGTCLVFLLDFFCLIFLLFPVCCEPVTIFNSRDLAV